MSLFDRRDWDTWWAAYPRKVGKLAAEKAYAKARKRASVQDLLTGIARYIQHKPDWQAYAHPASWLNAGRWMDDYSVPAPSEAPKPYVPPAYRPYVPLADRLKREAGN
jgi:hypothetical protein